MFLKTASIILFAAGLMTAAPINQVSYASLTGTQLVTFDDIAGGPAPGTNYDSTFVSGGAAFGERFAGQTNTPSGNFDVLNSVATGPLAVVAGPHNQNLNVFDFSTNVLTGLGPLGFPNFDAIGEGSFAVLFSSDQSQFGFQLVGGDGGSAVLNFFRRDGSLIQTVTVSNLANDFYGFQRDANVKDIAGISIHNADPAGIGFDNLKFDVKSDFPGVPEPSTYTLIAGGLAALAFRRRK